MISPTYQGQLYDPTVAAEVKKTGVESGMGQDAFLKMFMAQVTNQNPLDPMDNTEFTAQLATFYQLEQLQKISGYLEGMEDMKKTLDQTAVLSYLGKEATMAGDVMPVSQGQVGEMTYDLDGNAKVSIKITSQDGSLVKEIDLGRQTAGHHQFQWDGKDMNGDKVADGAYRLTVMAYDSQGNPVAVNNQQVSGLVTGYKKDEDGNVYLMLGEAALPMDKVISVQLPPPQEDQTSNALSQWMEENSGDDQDTDGQTTGSVTDFLKALATVGGLAASLL